MMRVRWVWRLLGHDPVSMAGVGREQAMVAQEMASLSVPDEYSPFVPR